MKKILFSIALLFLLSLPAEAAMEVIATSPWVAVLANSIGGANVEAISLTNWEGNVIRGRDAVNLTYESNVVALDEQECEKLGLNRGQFSNLHLLYEKAPFKINEKEYYFGDPSAMPFIAQRVFKALSALDPDNYNYYQRGLSVFQTRLNSTILAGRHLLRGLKVLDLTGGGGYLLIAAGCEVVIWGRGQWQGTANLGEAVQNVRNAGGVVVLDSSTSRAIRTVIGAGGIELTIARPPVNEDFMAFLHNQYLLLWEQAKDKVPESW